MRGSEDVQPPPASLKQVGGSKLAGSWHLHPQERLLVLYSGARLILRIRLPQVRAVS